MFGPFTPSLMKEFHTGRIGLLFPFFKDLAFEIITAFTYATAFAAPISIGRIEDHYSVLTGLRCPYRLPFLLFFRFWPNISMYPKKTIENLTFLKHIASNKNKSYNMTTLRIINPLENNYIRSCHVHSV